MSKNRLAYILNYYPKLSETFIQREINEVRNSINLDIIALRYENIPVKNVFYVFEKSIFNVLFNSAPFLIMNFKTSFFIISSILKQLSNQPIRTITKQLIFLFYSPIIVKKIKQEQINHIHSHLGNATTISLFCKLFNPNTHFSFTAHASADIYVLPELLKLKCEHADLIITNTNYNKLYLNSFCGFLKSDKIKIVRNGIKINNNSDPANVFNRKELLLLSVGRLIKCKGFHSLIYIANILNKEKIKFNLKIIGKGEEQSNLKDLIAHLNLQNKVELLGEQSNSRVLEEIKKCDIFVLHSEIFDNGYRDGLPTVIIEAMSLGKPVISTNISGIPEIIENGKNGFLVSEREYKNFASAIENFVKNPALLKEFGLNSREKIKKDYNIEKNVKQLINYFEELSEK